ncbi:uncharacterized protein [Nicotiana sylvestris]|uniref:uncharacterized protein n=1 Tax=Nicotiana sylvestris TaxID=4096 RepID=UPI00388C4F49
MYFPDEEVSFIGEDIAESYNGWRMFVDGAKNFKGVGIGAVLISETGQHYPVSAKLRFPIPTIWTSTRRIDNQELQDTPVPASLQELRKRFTKIEFQHVPRIQNEFANTLSTLSSMIKHPDKNFIDPIPVNIHYQPTHCVHVEEEADGKPWYLRASSTGPFAAWGIDVIGQIEPAASNGHMFILVAIDYFTKWVEAASYKAVTKKVVVDFIHDRIVYRFGILESIITDNSSNLNTDLMKAMCETFRIRHKNSTAYRPQMNGAIEAANKNIKKILRKMIEKHKQWHEKLSFSLLGYHTKVCTSTRENPYMLVYGTEAVIPAEVEIPSLRIIQEAGLDDAEWVKSHYEQLAL